MSVDIRKGSPTIANDLVSCGLSSPCGVSTESLVFDMKERGRHKAADP